MTDCSVAVLIQKWLLLLQRYCFTFKAHIIYYIFSFHSILLYYLIILTILNTKWKPCCSLHMTPHQFRIEHDLRMAVAGRVRKIM